MNENIKYYEYNKHNKVSLVAIESIDYVSLLQENLRAQRHEDGEEERNGQRAQSRLLSPY